jgi:hypothetical protein
MPALSAERELHDTPPWRGHLPGCQNWLIMSCSFHVCKCCKAKWLVERSGIDYLGTIGEIDS